MVGGLAHDWFGNQAVQAALSPTCLSIARGFLRYLKAFYPETEIPDRSQISSVRRPAPYILARHEIEAMMAAAGQLGPHGSLRPHTHRTLLGLLACTGLRVGEALKLRVSDVQPDGSPPRLFIRNSKFDKSRFVAVHPTAAAQLRRYAQLRRDLDYGLLSDIFFISEQGRELDGRILRRTFKRLLRLSGISPRTGQRYPSLHSLRHTFAVERLRGWYQSATDTRALLPNLSVYLGHVDPASSYWYLTATPELIGPAAQLFERYASKGGNACRKIAA